MKNGRSDPRKNPVPEIREERKCAFVAARASALLRDALANQNYETTKALDHL